MYGYRKVSDDLRELGEQCGINRVHRLMRSAGIRSQTGYAKRKYKRGGAPALVAPNHLQRQFDVFQHRQLLEEAGNLERARDLAAGDFFGPQRRDVLAPKDDAPGGRPLEGDATRGP